MVDGGAVYPEQSMLSFALRQSFDIKFPEEEEAEADEAGGEGPARSWEDVYRPKRGGVERPQGESIPRRRKASTSGTVVNLATWDTSTVEISPNFRDWYFLSHQLQLTNDMYDFTLLDLDATTTISFTTGPLGREEGELDQSWRDATDAYGEPRTPEDEDLDPNVYNIDTITGRRYEAGEGMGRGWNFSLTHDYTWSEGGFDLHTLRGAFSFDLTKKWRMGYDAYYDIAEREVISEHYRVYRNLHRWEAEVRISLERGDVIYWFQIRLIDIPEIEFYTTQTRTF